MARRSTFCGTALAISVLSLLGSSTASRAGASGKSRTYYIAADEVTWDYVPGGVDEIAGRPFADTAFFQKAPPRPVGTAYLKALYREYTDSTFRTLRPRSPQ